MPVPSMIPETASLATLNLPAIVNLPAVVAPRRSTPLSRRGFAYAVDFCLVAGCASYFSVLFSVLVLSLQAAPIGSLGRSAEAAFLDAYELAGGQLFPGSFAFFSVLFWVAVPLVAGKTFGMGLCGLRIETVSGTALTTRQLLRRLAGCWINYLTLGAASFPAFLEGSDRHFQDRVSGTRVVVGE